MSAVSDNKKFVYACIQGNVLVENAYETPLMNTYINPKRPIYINAIGDLEGFNPFTGIFKAPKAGFYYVTLFCNYYAKAKSKIQGQTNTKMIAFVETGGSQYLAPFGSTNPFTVFQNTPVSAVSLSGLIPLKKDEMLAISLYQENNQRETVQVFAEWSVTESFSYNTYINYTKEAKGEPIDIRCSSIRGYLPVEERKESEPIILQKGGQGQRKGKEKEKFESKYPKFKEDFVTFSSDSVKERQQKQKSKKQKGKQSGKGKQQGKKPAEGSKTLGTLANWLTGWV